MQLRRYRDVTLAAVMLFFWAGQCRATEILRAELAAVSGSISKLLEGEGEDSIAIGQFTGPPNFPTSAGPGIVKILVDEFDKRGITVKKRARIALKGEYSLSETEMHDRNNKLTGKFLAIRIVGSLVDQFGAVITDFNFEGKAEGIGQPLAEIDDGSFESKIADEQTFVQFTGLPVHLPASYPPEDRDHRIREYIVDPPSQIAHQTRLSTSRESPYAIEIVVNGKSRNIELDEGLPFVQINRGETYEVNIINDSPHDAAVTLTIDGLNSFEFSDIRHTSGRSKGLALYHHYIVANESKYAIRGWHRNNHQVDSFLVTRFAEGRAAKKFQAALNHSSAFGTITVTFAAAWPEGSLPPRDERGRRSLPENATGKGLPKEVQLKEVRYHVGIIRDSVSVRYSN